MQNMLFYGNTHNDKNIKYLIKSDVHDDLIVMRIDSRLIIVSSALEFDRLKSESNADELYNVNEFGKDVPEAEIVSQILHKHYLNEISVMSHFPIKLAMELEILGVKIDVTEFTKLPERSIKSEKEIKEIKKSVEVNKLCFDMLTKILKASTISDNKILIFNREILTVEFIKSELSILCLKHGAVLEDPIVSVGGQTSRPHCTGEGPVYANEFIVADLCPCMKNSGYYSDVTRTFLKGQATDKQQKMYDVVLKAQKDAILGLKQGINGRVLNEKVLNVFESYGYKTDSNCSNPFGMFHSLGHSFGLNIHEYPSIWKRDVILQSGNVVTIEPGLYYPDFGGVRIEDDILITDYGYINLTSSIDKNFIVG